MTISKSVRVMTMAAVAVVATAQQLTNAFGPSAFDIEGIKLINQSTVMTAGGFPYVLSQPGSYKLSGNLTMSTTSRGNYRNSNGAYDIAIAINASGVVLDLNGFSIIVTNANSSLRHPYHAIADLARFRQVVIRNGTISMHSVVHGDTVAISLLGTAGVVEDLRVSAVSSDGAGISGVLMRMSSPSIIRRNIFEGLLELDCTGGTLMIENFFMGFFRMTGATGCKLINNNFDPTVR